MSPSLTPLTDLLRELRRRQLAVIEQENTILRFQIELRGGKLVRSDLDHRLMLIPASTVRTNCDG